MTATCTSLILIDSAPLTEFIIFDIELGLAVWESSKNPAVAAPPTAKKERRFIFFLFLKFKFKIHHKYCTIAGVIPN
jgi:hypothetical protein